MYNLLANVPHESTVASTSSAGTGPGISLKKSSKVEDDTTWKVCHIDWMGNLTSTKLGICRFICEQAPGEAKTRNGLHYKISKFGKSEQTWFSWVTRSFRYVYDRLQRICADLV
jgi:hypothetical protein